MASHPTSPGGASYTLPTLAELSGIDYRTLFNWQKRGLIEPTRQPTNGSGSIGLYDYADAIQVLVLAELRLSGVEVRILETVAADVRRISRQNPACEDRLVVTNEAAWLSSDGELSQRLPADRTSVVVPLAGVFAALSFSPVAAA